MFTTNMNKLADDVATLKAKRETYQKLNSHSLYGGHEYKYDNGHHCTDGPYQTHSTADWESAAVARCLMQAGADKIAPERAPTGPLKSFLENR